MRKWLGWLGAVMLGVGAAATQGLSQKAVDENRPMAAVEYLVVLPFAAGAGLLFWWLRTEKNRPECMHPGEQSGRAE